MVKGMKRRAWLGKATRNDTHLTPARLPVQPVEPAWLEGAIEVQVAGESFHLETVRAAAWSASPSLGSLIAVLRPEPANPHDRHAVAVYVQDGHVGYLPADIAARVQSALLAFGEAHGGCLVSCPAVIREYSIGPQIVLLLDPGPLGLGPEALESVPELARAVARLITRLDTAAPAVHGVDAKARAMLATAEKNYADVCARASYEQRADAWPHMERAFHDAAVRLGRAEDPMSAAAWLGVARSARYRRGRRDETLAAYVEAAFYDRENPEAWSELIEYVTAAPHIPTLVGLVARAPRSVRPTLLRQLLVVSDGRDRLGRLSLQAGSRLRAALLDLVESQNDDPSIAVLAGDAGMRAYKDGDIDSAVSAWRRATAAGSTDAKVADRYSVLLVKQGEYATAAQVLRQALAAPPPSVTMRERLEKRLARCERA